MNRQLFSISWFRSYLKRKKVLKIYCFCFLKVSIFRFMTVRLISLGHGQLMMSSPGFLKHWLTFFHNFLDRLIEIVQLYLKSSLNKTRRICMSKKTTKRKRMWVFVILVKWPFNALYINLTIFMSASVITWVLAGRKYLLKHILTVKRRKTLPAVSLIYQPT